ncbi:MAG: DUF4352 domain-containing protein [Kurthia gibsonii]
MRKSLVALSLVALFLLSACGNATEEKNGEKAESSSTTDTSKNGTKYEIGHTVKIDHVDFTITSAKLSDGEKNIKPKGKALTLDVTAKNESDKKVLLASTEFTLYKNGKKQESYFGETNHLDGNLDRNKTVKGVLQYDVEGAGEYELIYKPAYINDKKEYKWHIEVK